MDGGVISTVIQDALPSRRQEFIGRGYCDISLKLNVYLGLFNRESKQIKPV